MVQRFWKLSDWPNWPVLCLYRPPAKTPVRTQNLPHKYYAPNFSQTFYECPFTLWYKDRPNWPVLLSNARSDLCRTLLRYNFFLITFIPVSSLHTYALNAWMVCQINFKENVENTKNMHTYFFSYLWTKKRSSAVNTNVLSQLPLCRNTESGIQSKEVVIDLPGRFKRPTTNNTNNQYSKRTFLLILNLCGAHSTQKKTTSRALIKRKLPQSVCCLEIVVFIGTWIVIFNLFFVWKLKILIAFKIRVL